MSISEARRRLPELADSAWRDRAEVLIVRRGKVVAKLVPVAPEEEPRHALRGLPIRMAADFNEPMGDLWEAEAGGAPEGPRR